LKHRRHSQNYSEEDIDKHFIMANPVVSTVLFLYILFITFTLGRERDVWSIGNIELRPEASPLPDIKFGFWRKLHPDCAKSQINPNGCMIPEDQRISNKTCSGGVGNNNEWQICLGVKNLQKGSVRWRLKKNTFRYFKGEKARLVIEIVRKEEIHELVYG